MTLSAALSTFSGQNFGAKKNDRVLRGYKVSLIMMAILTVFLMLVMQVFGRAIASFFVPEQDVVLLAAKGLRITSIFYLTHFMYHLFNKRLLRKEFIP
jgi:Na+-driven multidrug efflux pump